MVNIQQTGVREVGIPRELSKLYALIAFTSLTGLLAGYLLNTGNIAVGAVVLIIFLAFFILETVLIRAQRLGSIAAAFGVVAFALPFIKLISFFFIAAFIVFTAFLFYGAYRGRIVMENMVEIHVSRVVRVASTPVITAIVIFLSAALILNSNFSVERGRVDQVIELGAPVIGRFVEGFSSDMQARDFFETIAGNNTADNIAFQSLPPAQQALVMERAVTELKERTEEFLGTQIDLDASVSENAHTIVSQKLEALTPRTQLYWSMAVIAIIWLSVRSIEFIIYLPLAGLTLLIYELFIALGFASVQIEPHSKEVISLE